MRIVRDVGSTQGHASDLLVRASELRRPVRGVVGGGQS